MSGVLPISSSYTSGLAAVSRISATASQPVSFGPPSQGEREDSLTLSAEGQKRAAAEKETRNSAQSKEGTAAVAETSAILSEAELKELRQLKSRDQEVRTHEQAHLSAAGQYASGGASFSYQKGPDGNKYAVGGEVPIDVGKEKTPEETVRKMQVVKKAALAPANPSAADRQIAAQATMTEAQARQDILKENQQELNTLVSDSATANKDQQQPAPAVDSTNASENGQSMPSTARRMMIQAYTANIPL